MGNKYTKGTKQTGSTGEASSLTFLVPFVFFSVFFVYVYPTSAGAQTPGAFTPTGDMTTPRLGHTAALLPNG